MFIIYPKILNCLTVAGSAEDTFILLDALEEDTAELRESKPKVCLEIGYVGAHHASGLVANTYPQTRFGLCIQLYWSDIGLDLLCVYRNTCYCL